MKLSALVIAFFATGVIAAHCWLTADYFWAVLNTGIAVIIGFLVYGKSRLAGGRE